MNEGWRGLGLKEVVKTSGPSSLTPPAFGGQSLCSPT